MAEHYMNPAYGALMGSAGTEKGEQVKTSPTKHKGGAGHAKHPHISIHSHAGGHEVHITHPDGQVEHHHHELGDAEGIARHIHEHMGEGSAPEGHELAEMGEEQTAAGER